MHVRTGIARTDFWVHRSCVGGVGDWTLITEGIPAGLGYIASAMTTFGDYLVAVWMTYCVEWFLVECNTRV